MAADHRTRILIVDDSVVMRNVLRSIVSADACLEVAGTAGDGESALRLVEILHPDLILLDVEMPVMDGLATLKELRRRRHAMPVIMCSSLTQRGASVTLDALACGACDYVTKPSGQTDRENGFRELSRELLDKIRALTGSPQPASRALRAGTKSLSLVLPAAPAVKPQPIRSAPAIVVIGVSTGGPAALETLLPALPEDFPLPVLVVQHMPEVFTSLLAERLNSHCRLRVCEAAEGLPASAGTIYVARGNWHLEVAAGPQPTLHLTQAPPENHCRPAADVLFRSAAKVYGSSALAVVLTGMGCDGMNGCRTIRERGGSVLAQDQSTSTVWGMPGAVVGAGLAHKILPLPAIAPEIVRIVHGTSADRSYRMVV
jgi:two-component system, chemotaxis family, protein-glutamate methylesterase/glutaminase